MKYFAIGFLLGNITCLGYFRIRIEMMRHRDE